MEKTNNDSNTKNNSVRGLVIFGIAMLAGLLIVGGGLYYVYKIYSPKQSQSESIPAAGNPSPTSTPESASAQSSAMENTSPASSPESALAQSANDLTGKWTGKYKVTSPKGCAGASGSWTADVTQSGGSFSGSYKSDVVSGVVSGNSSGTKNFNWIVTGGGGA